MRITYAAPATGAELPTVQEGRALLRIVGAAHVGLRDTPFDEFSRAFWFVSRCFRTGAPNRARYWSSWIDDANELLGQHGAAQVNGASLLCACLAAGDVIWRQANAARGDVLEVGLDRYSGRPATNAWRKLLDGSGNLLASISSRDPGVDNTGRPIPTPRIYKDGRPIGEHESLWS